MGYGMLWQQLEKLLRLAAAWATATFGAWDGALLPRHMFNLSCLIDLDHKEHVNS